VFAQIHTHTNVVYREAIVKPHTIKAGHVTVKPRGKAPAISTNYKLTPFYDLLSSSVKSITSTTGSPVSRIKAHSSLKEIREQKTISDLKITQKYLDN